MKTLFKSKANKWEIKSNATDGKTNYFFLVDNQTKLVSLHLNHQKTQIGNQVKCYTIYIYSLLRYLNLIVLLYNYNNNAGCEKTKDFS
ncbi:hypothetical protein L6452_21804 [Arctium lappa]|uniref:Uncharacterized protein n=1 Tax=Arctium lappa TaxID=4217 RepID=A0ACB9AXN5_ARCLA|nr:hypothetical protein L6452_21804 [Arctium lappa]